MIYSVFRYGRGTYDYYQGPELGTTHAGTPPMRTHAQLGATPEQAGWIVPVGARKIGSGEMPRGRIATFGGGSSLGDVASGGAMRLGIIALVAYLAWKAYR